MYITFSYETGDFMVNHEGMYYQTQFTDILCLQDALFLDKLPSASSFELNQDNNYRKVAIMNYLTNDDYWEVSGATSQAYIFYVEQNPGNTASLPNAIVNLGNVPSAQGVSFHKSGNTL